MRIHALSFSLAIMASSSFGFLWVGSPLWTAHIKPPQVIEVVRWRQPVCVQPAVGVPPCLQSFKKYQEEYELVSGSHASKDNDEGYASDESSEETQSDEASDARANFESGARVLSPAVVDTVNFDRLEPSELEVADEDAHRRLSRLSRLTANTPVLDGKRREGAREGKHFMISSIVKDVNVKPPPIFVTKVLDSPVTATLVAHNCLPDVGVPLCDGYLASVSLVDREPVTFEQKRNASSSTTRTPAGESESSGSSEEIIESIGKVPPTSDVKTVEGENTSGADQKATSSDPKTPTSDEGAPGTYDATISGAQCFKCVKKILQTETPVEESKNTEDKEDVGASAEDSVIASETLVKEDIFNAQDGHLSTEKSVRGEANQGNGDETNSNGESHPFVPEESIKEYPKSEKLDETSSSAENNRPPAAAPTNVGTQLGVEEVSNADEISNTRIDLSLSEKPARDDENPEQGKDANADDHNNSSASNEENNPVLDKDSYNSDKRHQKPAKMWLKPQTLFQGGEEQSNSDQSSKRPFLEAIQKIIKKPHSILHKPYQVQNATQVISKPIIVHSAESEHNASVSKPTLDSDAHSEPTTEVEHKPIIDSLVASVLNVVEKVTSGPPTVTDAPVIPTSPRETDDRETANSAVNTVQTQKPDEQVVVQMIHDIVSKPHEKPTPIVTEPEIKPLLIVESPQKPGFFDHLWKPSLFDKVKHTPSSTTPASTATLLVDNAEAKPEEEQSKKTLVEVPETITFSELLHKPENEISNRPGLLDVFKLHPNDNGQEVFAKPTVKPGIFGGLFANPERPVERRKRDAPLRFLNLGNVLAKPTNKPLVIERPYQKPLLVQNPIYVVEKPPRFAWSNIFKKPEATPVIEGDHDVISEPTYIYQKPPQKPQYFGGIFQGWNIFGSHHTTKEKETTTNDHAIAADQRLVNVSPNENSPVIVFERPNQPTTYDDDNTN